MKLAKLPPHPDLSTLLQEIPFTPAISFYSKGPAPGEKGAWGGQFTLGNDTDWSADYHDLTVRYDVGEIPELNTLFGVGGLAPRSATLLLVLEWVSVDSGWRCFGEPWPFNAQDQQKEQGPIGLWIRFPPNSIRGKGTLTPQLLLADPGQPTADESMLAGTAGYRFGPLDSGTDIVIDGDGSLFPILEEDLGPLAPLWEFRKDWTDPFEEDFSVAYLALALNTSHPDYGYLKNSNAIAASTWTPLLRQVVASWLVVLILELQHGSGEDFEDIASGKSGRALPGSIADAVSYILRIAPLDLASASSLAISAQQWIDDVMIPETESE
ncbi:MAG: hypothetical protein JWQ01_4731 [Massilia sp.]|nr:hypothetical protein [Massilia sp.]